MIWGSFQELIPSEMAGPSVIIITRHQWQDHRSSSINHHSSSALITRYQCHQLLSPITNRTPVPWISAGYLTGVEHDTLVTVQSSIIDRLDLTGVEVVPCGDDELWLDALRHLLHQPGSGRLGGAAHPPPIAHLKQSGEITTCLCHLCAGTAAVQGDILHQGHGGGGVSTMAGTGRSHKFDSCMHAELITGGYPLTPKVL